MNILQRTYHPPDPKNGPPQHFHNFHTVFHSKKRRTLRRFLYIQG